MTFTYTEWKARAAGLTFRNDLYIDGAFCPAASGQRFETVNPGTGEILTDVARGGAEDIDRAVKSARRAFEDGRWSRKTPGERKEVLLTLAALIRENVPELALLDTLDMGKTISDSSTIDAPGSAHFFQWHAEAIDKLYDEVAPTGGRDLALIRRVPLGVVGAVVPWNFPLDMATWKLAPALAAGNSVVLKPAEQSPLSALMLTELATRAGLPDGVLNVVTGYGEDAGQALGRHPDVDCLVFTGSTAVGKLFQRYAGESNMKQVWLETGGKSPNLIFADADLDAAADMAAFGIFFNQGHVCCAGSRLLVQESVADEVLERLKRRMATLRLGDPLDKNTDVGAINSAAQLARIRELSVAGEAEGAERWSAPCELPTSGYWFAPTLFTGVSQAHRIAREEIFGPVLSVLTFRTPSEAVEKANNTPYGLSAGIWTEKGSRILDVAGKLRAGVVWANTFNKFDPTSPFGGYKESGYGREGGRHGLAAYLKGGQA